MSRGVRPNTLQQEGVNTIVQESKKKLTDRVLNDIHTRLMICARSKMTKKPRSLQTQSVSPDLHGNTQGVPYGKNVSQYDDWSRYVLLINSGKAVQQATLRAVRIVSMVALTAQVLQDFLETGAPANLTNDLLDTN